MSGLTARDELRRVTREAWPSLLLASVGVNVLGLALPIFILQIYDRVLTNESRTSLAVLTFGLTLAVAAEILLRLLRHGAASWTAARTEHILRTKAVEGLLRTSLATYKAGSAGAYLDTLNSIPSIRDFEAHQRLVICIDVAFALLYLGLIAYLGRWLVLAPLGLLALSGASAFVVGRQLHAAASHQKVVDRRRYDVLMRVLGGILTVKALALSGLMLRSQERLQEASADAVRKVMFRGTLAQTLANLFAQLNTICLVTCGALLVLHGQLSLGGLTACTLLSGRSLQPIQSALSVWAGFQSVQLTRNEAAALIALPHEQIEEGERITLRGTVELDAVSFRYGDTGPMLIDELSLRVGPGEIVGIEGASGSGKTTLLSMILGLLSPERGSVRFDGKELKTLSLEVVRRQTALLSRDGAIFSGTILDNLSNYRDGEAANEALYLAFLLGLNEPIRRLPQGFDTPIERANVLPDGLRQRIAIARQLVDGPKVILFDEADHALDLDSRTRLIRVLRDLGEGSSLILISANPDILALAQRRYRLEDGRLVPSSVQPVRDIAA
jgi:ATP-binding cassette subfamily C protein LapB